MQHEIATFPSEFEGFLTDLTELFLEPQITEDQVRLAFAWFATNSQTAV